MIIRTLLDVLIPVVWLLLAVVIVTYFWRTSRRHGTLVAFKRLFSYRLIVPLVVVVSLTIVRAVLVFVLPQQIGVVVSIISPGGIRPEPLHGGLHFIVPLAERVVFYPIYNQTLTMSTRPSENDVPGDDSIRTRTADGQAVTIDATVIFQVDPTENRVVQLHIKWQDRYVMDLLRPAMRSALRDRVSAYTVDEVNSAKRADFVKRFQESMRERAKGSGLIIHTVLIRNIAFSKQYAESVEQKQMAFQGMTRAQYEAKQIENLSKGKAERIKILADANAEEIVIKAKAAAEAQVLKAEAEARALRLVGAALNRRQDLLTYRYIDKLAPNIKVMLLPSKTPLILPLPQLETEPVSKEKASMEGNHRPESADTRPAFLVPAPSQNSSTPENPTK